jgi:RimJ/RimL family protein N-acetyltransferase
MPATHRRAKMPTGRPLPAWRRRPAPPRTPMPGRFCRLEPLEVRRHAADLFAAFREDAEGLGWTYLPYGPFKRPTAFRSWLAAECGGEDPLFFAVVDANGRAVGMTGFLRIQPAIGVIELGHIHFAPRLQRTPAATEAIFLMLRRVFDELGYRRCEWKCDSLNAASRSAADRLGFTFEGLFRQATIYKRRNRDTAWYSVIDREWPALRASFRRWLAPANFEPDGSQRTRLNAGRRPPRQAAQVSACERICASMRSVSRCSRR